jgi:hypothetical protein
MWISVNPELEIYPRINAALWAINDKKTCSLDITPEQLADGYNALEKLGLTPHEIYYSIEDNKHRPGFITLCPSYFHPQQRDKFLKSLEEQQCLNET